ncbi:MAG: hypothetical protein HQK58_03835 [Deltaproteobacteria bacterium]|nr:hypothetical protein [Deltaproteobacteria bacterium]
MMVNSFTPTSGGAWTSMTITWANLTVAVAVILNGNSGAIYHGELRHPDHGRGVDRRPGARKIDSIWVFLEARVVDPTNNLGERSLSCAVLW